MIIIPDVHGRKFWKDAVLQKQPGEKVIFLGDYVDPYIGYEDVDHDDAYREFNNILEYKKENPEEVELLIGNHDFYYLDKNMACCRHDPQYKRWNSLFKEYRDFFKLAYQQIIGKYNYLITHAGVHKEWLDILVTVYPFQEGMSIADFLNSLLKTEYNDFRNYLAIHSRYRGLSSYKYGSCIWADVREWVKAGINERIPGIYQIFGHTRLDEPFFGEGWAMLDARRGFRLTNDNKFINLNKKEDDKTDLENTQG